VVVPDNGDAAHDPLDIVLFQLLLLQLQAPHYQTTDPIIRQLPNELGIIVHEMHQIDEEFCQLHFDLGVIGIFRREGE
jgi:hypothetical protein